VARDSCVYVPLTVSDPTLTIPWELRSWATVSEPTASTAVEPTEVGVANAFLPEASCTTAPASTDTTVPYGMAVLVICTEQGSDSASALASTRSVS
jgi:hypothetical protein